MIRRAISSDLNHLTALIRAFPSPTIPGEGYIRSCLTTLLSDPKAYLAVAVDADGTVVGYLSGYRHAAFYAAGETVWCDEVFSKRRSTRPWPGEAAHAGVRDMGAGKSLHTRVSRDGRS
jgi:hypothetical protein